MSYSFNDIKYSFDDFLKTSSEGELLIRLGSEFHSFGTGAENEPPKRVFLDLGTDREP